jgi:hypothetical protein
MHEETKPRHWVVLGLACQGTSRDRWTRQQGIGSCLAWLAKALVVIAGQGTRKGPNGARVRGTIDF